MESVQPHRLTIHSNAVEQLTCSAPPYVCEILLESEISLLWEFERGFVLRVQPRTLNQVLILLQEQSVIAVLKSVTQVFHPNILRLHHGQIKRDIPVEDFLSFCDCD